MISSRIELIRASPAATAQVAKLLRMRLTDCVACESPPRDYLRFRRSLIIARHHLSHEGSNRAQAPGRDRPCVLLQVLADERSSRSLISPPMGTALGSPPIAAPTSPASTPRAHLGIEAG